MSNKDPNDMTEQEKIAEMGKPKLGEIYKVNVKIEESPEFKVNHSWLLFFVFHTRFSGY